MFEFETEYQRKYRELIHQVAIDNGKALKLMIDTKKNEIPDYNKIKNQIKKNHIKLLNAIVPSVYDKLHELLLEGMLYYIKGFEILISLSIANQFNDTKKINRANTYIEMANSYVIICSGKQLEIIEKLKKGYKK